jgi:23S rRNA (uracil1939-C5)-methyltransferase|tara:strand:- start:54 stop:1280 length:1227 start_codon:yes stop_codon:yes gene_type:complete
MQIPKNFISTPFEYHEEVELKIDHLANLGMGVGRVNGWVVMVPFVIPGELVKVRIYRNHSQYSEGDLLEILESSKYRVSPKCSLFESCGGCQYQHIDYGEQLKIKTQQVKELLEKNGGIQFPVSLAKSSKQVFGYRSKITPHYNRPNKNGDQPIGFLKYGRRHDIVDVKQCVIATDAINESLPEMREKAVLEGGKKRRQRGGTLLLRDTLEGVVNNPKAIVSEKVGELTFQFKAGEFFQNNPYILPDLVEFVKFHASGNGIKHLVDTYCGVGLFALSLSQVFELVVGVEISEAAIQLAKVNAQIHDINNVRFQIGKAEAIFQHIKFSGENTSVIIDPPRKGCDLAFIEQLLDFNPQKIIYVSCDPATQARDLNYFVENAYKLTEVQPFDLFPHTRHIESVAILERISN